MFFYLFLFLTINISSAQIGHLGEQCANEISEPPCVVPNSICVKGFCKCAPFYRQYGKECISKDPSKTYGTKCTTSNDCSAIGEFCDTYGICKCLSNYLEISKTCRPIVYPGQYGCEDSRQCSVAHPGAICSIEGVCQCPNGFVPRSRDCISPVSISGFGNNHNERRYAPSRYRQAHIRMQHIPKRRPSSSDLNWSPNCPPGEVYVQEADLCMSTREPGEPCQYTQQCGGASSGTFCSRQRCECIYGMIISAEGCISSKRECHNIGEVWVAEVGGCKQILPPGSVGCTHSSQCSGAFNGSICFNQTCTCPPGLLAADNTCGISCPAGETYSAVSGVCHPVVGPGEHCQYSSQCSAYHPDTVCDRGKCRCLGRQVYAESACLEDCPDGTNLNENGICTKGCGPSEIEYIGKCYPKVGTGENCLSDKQCPQHATCLRGICECTPTLVARSGRCLPVEVPPQGECLNGELCLGGSECIDGLCKCPKGTVISKNQCILPTIAKRTVPPNSPCNPSVTCAGGSTCISNVCQCADGEVVSDGTCKTITTHSLGHCIDSTDCFGGSHCDEKRNLCICPEGKVPQGNHCVRKDVQASFLPMQKCLTDKECTSGTRCIKYRCRCPVGYVFRDGYCHIDQADLGQTCSQTECKDALICVDNICKCPETHHESDGKCVSKEDYLSHGYPGYPCRRGVQCVHDSTCKNGYCECPEGMISYNRKCQEQPQSFVTEKCGSGEKCIGGSYCDYEDRVCKCPRGSTPIDGECQRSNPVTPAPRRCLSNNHCPSGATCVNGRCKCPHGTASSRFGFCVPISNKKLERKLTTIDDQFRYKRMLNDHCYVAEDCVSGSTCVNGICLCLQDRIPSGKRCIPERFAQHCYNGEDCGEMSNCVDGYCKCHDGTIKISKSCGFHQIARRSPGMQCIFDPTACRGGSYCFNGFCVCPPGTYVVRGICSTNGKSPALISTAQSMGPGDPCEENGIILQCAGNSICANGVCTCPSGEYVMNGICVSRDTQAQPGGTCQFGVTRCTGGSQCINFICTCPMGQASFRGQCTSVYVASIYPNQPCSYRSNCVGGSQCLGGMCRCPRGTMAQQNSPYCSSSYLQYPTMQNYYENPYNTPYNMGTPGQRCDFASMNAPCRGGSICVNQFCICPANKIISGENCIAFSGHVPAGSPCQQEGKVCSGGSTCVNGFCQCGTGTMQYNDQCVPSQPSLAPILEPGAACVSQCNRCAQCGGGSMCLNGICSCPLGQYASNTRCIPIIPTSYVTQSFSQNPPNNIENPPNNISPSFRMARPGDSCNANIICGGGSSCIIGQCVCSVGYVPNKERDSCMNAAFEQQTIASVGPGESCTGTITCTGGSTCVQNICTCPPNNFIFNRRCELRKLPRALYPGSACALIDSCLQNSKCYRGYCTCIGNRFANSSGHCIDNFTMERSTGLAGSYCGSGSPQCVVSTICSSWNYCICIGEQEGNGHGQCTFHATNIKTMSSYKVLKTQKCESNEECKGSQICLNGSCVCSEGTRKSTNGECVSQQRLVPPGSWCDDSVVICSGGSMCHQHSCICPYGHVINAQQCVPQSY